MTATTPPNFPEQLYAHFLYTEQAQIDQSALLEALQKRVGRAESPAPKPGMLMFFFPDKLVEFKDGPVPAQCHLLMPPKRAIDLGRFETARHQSYHFPGAFDKVKQCTHEVLLSDQFTIGLLPTERVTLFMAMVRALCEVAPPTVVYFLHPDRFEDPAALLAAESSNEPLHGCVNVRLFRNSEAGEGHYLMDTLGLHALGFADFQMHFSDKQPNEVAALLYDYADYVFEEGVVIKNGDHIQGLEEGENLLCRMGPAFVGPERQVLDLS